MMIEFDPAKDAINRDKHGLSLGEAALMEWGSAVLWPDARFDYGEKRMCALGYVGARLYFVVFVDRHSGKDNDGKPQYIRRIISLRRANPREEKRYASTET